MTKMVLMMHRLGLAGNSRGSPTTRAQSWLPQTGRGPYNIVDINIIGASKVQNIFMFVIKLLIIGLFSIAPCITITFDANFFTSLSIVAALFRSLFSGTFCYFSEQKRAINITVAID